jgi:nicastrin
LPDSPQRPKIPPFRYISVYSSHISDATGWSYRILGFLVGRLQQLPKENCTQLPLYWYAGYKKIGECRETTQNLSLASSPAFFLPSEL